MRLDPREAERLRSLCETAQHHPDHPSVPVRPEVLLCLLSNVSTAPALPEGYTIHRTGKAESQRWELRANGWLSAEVAGGEFSANYRETIPVSALRALLDAAERGTP